MTDTMKVIEIRVRVVDVLEDDVFEEDTDYEPHTICLTFEDEDAEMVYCEAEEITDCIERVVTG